MTITAHIASEGDVLKAVLSDSRILFACDPRELAGQLSVAGVDVDDVHCADWREGELAPLVGQTIVLKTEMRRLANLAVGMDGMKMQGKRILFLDFDGVLHPFPMPTDPAQLFCNLPRLEAVLRDFPDVQIVISSSWREDRSLAELASLFSPDITSRVIGVLPVIEIGSLTDVAAVRYREIERFLEALDDPAQWIALDDDTALFPSNCSHLVQCEDGFGIAEERALRNWLGRQCVEALSGMRKPGEKES